MRNKPKIDKATNEFIPAIAALAEKLSLSNLSNEQRQGAFLLPYTEAEYLDFAMRAEHFYVLWLGEQLLGFILAHGSETIDAFGGEVYLHMKNLLKEPFIVVRQICIAPEFLHRGYGRRLYEFLFERAEKDIPGYRKMLSFIWKHPPNLASEKFHRKLGWTELETYSLKNGAGAVGIWVATTKR